MRAIVSMMVAVGMLPAGATVAAAVPADGPALARLGQQVDAVVVAKTIGVAKTKKPKTATTGTTTSPPPAKPGRSY